MSTFDRRYETMPRPELEQVQLERLQALLVRLKRNVRRSREKIGDLRVESLADKEMPVTDTGMELQTGPADFLLERLENFVGLGGRDVPGGMVLDPPVVKQANQIAPHRHGIGTDVHAHAGSFEHAAALQHLARVIAQHGQIRGLAASRHVIFDGLEQPAPALAGEAIEMRMPRHL